MFVIDDIIKGVFDLAKTGMELGKPNQSVGGNLDAGPMAGNFYQSFAQATGAESPNYVEKRPESSQNAEIKSSMKEQTTPAASIGGAPVNAGAAVSDMVGAIPSQTGTYGANGSLIGAGQDAPMPGALAGQAADARAYEAAQSAQLGGALTDTALGLGQDIFSMNQQLSKPGPTGSIAAPPAANRNPRLSALLGSLYRG